MNKKNATTINQMIKKTNKKNPIWAYLEYKKPNFEG
jgi:hypothetical protein